MSVIVPWLINAAVPGPNAVALAFIMRIAVVSPGGTPTAPAS